MNTNADPAKICTLLARTLDGETLSATDQSLLDAWRNETSRNSEIYDKIVSREVAPEDHARYLKAVAADRWDDIGARIAARRRRAVSAAAVCAVLLGGYALWNLPDGNRNHPGFLIPADNSKAVLVLESGREIEIGNHITEDELSILGITRSDDALAYSETGEPETHRLYVPRNGICRVALSDGTEVTLNSGSVLAYPSRFTGTERRITLTGEAFFKVAADAGKPFVVSAGGAEVTVLGTEFNVMAYENLDHLEVTLVEGSVMVAGEGYAERLSPGMQAIAYSDGRGYEVRDVDTRLYVSWTGGVFEFADLPLANIARRLELWYDVEFSFADSSIRELPFTGSVDKDADLMFFLDLLKKTQAIDYKIDGKRVTLKKK